MVDIYFVICREKEVSALLVELKAKKEENGLLNEELSNLKALVDELNEKNCEYDISVSVS